ncbi:MAG: hypothetical protein R3189_06325 [Thiomicrorhabdus chilensis]|uniref:SMP-30/gluconolactonase/LRE family protein n=1 Tax=Thiomicrorhabdus chilensis TaxID=63656 RepID=UPI00299D064A|nr:hypothetical protein [Thiomicrorhabdus chilensis]MDX1347847.1 hypothetical protein [Thiomicrorhabdus chilensis]
MNIKSAPHQFLLSGLLLALTSFSVWAGTAESILIKDAGFATPESMEYYADEDVYLVANINGSPFAKDDNGFISKVTPDGQVSELKWLDGESEKTALNAPKGMAILNHRLYIADIDRIRVFSLPDGQQLKDIPVAGSTFMNGLSVAGENSLYATDSGMAPGFKPSGTDALYRIATDGQVQKLRSGSLGHPNGVIADGENIIMVTLGSGQIYFLDGQGDSQALMTLPYNRLDGLLKLDDGRIITSSWAAKSIYAIHENYTIDTITDGLESPADLGYDSKRNRLLIPLFLKDEILIHPLN